ncbi:hypothetical protein F4X90_21050, partial [Candidatus Poribacteria bacterium]|nr:hypothetical protein [Candidatus Poribacteria bacterium]
MKKLATLFFLTVLISTHVEANFNFALHTDAHPWAREDAKGTQQEIDNLIKILKGVNLEVFEPKDIDGLANWVKAHTDGGGN